MKEGVRQFFLGLITGASMFLAAILDEIMKFDTLSGIPDKSIAIALITGLIAAVAIWRAYLAKSPKE